MIDIDLDTITEPILACPNDLDNVKTLSEVAGNRIDEVFIGSWMTNIGHYRAAANVLKGRGQNAARLWVFPPTRMYEGFAESGRVVGAEDEAKVLAEV